MLFWNSLDGPASPHAILSRWPARFSVQLDVCASRALPKRQKSVRCRVWQCLPGKRGIQAAWYNLWTDLRESESARCSASSTSVNVNRDNFRNSMDKCVSSCGSGTYEINEEKKPCGTAFEPTCVIRLQTCTKVHSGRLSVQRCFIRNANKSHWVVDEPLKDLVLKDTAKKMCISKKGDFYVLTDFFLFVDGIFTVRAFLFCSIPWYSLCFSKIL